MKKFLIITLITLMSLAITGCMISSRTFGNRNSKDLYILPGGRYHMYTNINYNASFPHNYQTNRYCMYLSSSYSRGPWEGSDIYPASRECLNALSLYSYSEAASGDYMLIGPTLLVYPFVLIDLPIQFVLDTILLPYDLYNIAIPPENYIKVR